MLVTKSQKFSSGLLVKHYLLVLVLISSQFAMAADEGWYIGFNDGQSRANVDYETIVARMLNDGFTTVSLREVEKDRAYKLYAGYQFNSNIALEGGYFSLGEFGYKGNFIPVASLGATAKFSGLNLDLVGYMPISQKFSAFGRIGAIYSQATDQFTGSGPIIINPYTARNRDGNYKYGIGLQYDFSEKVAFRLEKERYLVDHDLPLSITGDIDMITLGVVLRLGNSAPVAVVPSRVEPAQVVEAPPPAPPPPPPEPMRVSFSADALFDFDSSVVKPEGRAELDKLGADLRGIYFDTIVVTGHSDRIGSQAYNLNLSTERANVVKNYLVRSANISADMVRIRAVNGSEPVTTLAQCGNQLSRPQLIVCLAPDRRVVVEVNGTRPR